MKTLKLSFFCGLAGGLVVLLILFLLAPSASLQEVWWVFEVIICPLAMLITILSLPMVLLRKSRPFVLYLGLYLALLAFGGWSLYSFWFLPAKEYNEALVACQFASNPLMAWHQDYEDGKNHLPSPWPGSFAEAIKYGYATKDDFKFPDIKLKYLVPSANAPDDYIMLEAETPRGKWVCHDTFDRRWIPKSQYSK